MMKQTRVGGWVGSSRRRLWSSRLLALACAWAVASPAQAQGQPQWQGNDFVPGEVVVGFATTAPSLRVQRTIGPIRSVTDENSVQGILDKHRVRALESLEGVGTGRLGPSAPPRNLRLVFDEKADVKAIVEELRSAEGVAFAEPNFLGGMCLTPSDPSFSQQQPEFDKILLREAWDIQPGANSSVRVAVIDTGVETWHPDLASVLDLGASYNFVDNNTNIFDDIGHGTRVAGIIAAPANNGEGIAGVAYGATIISYDVATSQGSITSARVVSALNAAVTANADIVNMSLKFGSYSSALETACNNAYSAGVLLVAASGNESQGRVPAYPASFSNVIGVGAISDVTTRRAWFSNYNELEPTLVDIVAPGDSIFSTIPGSQYNGTLGSGTSFAAPMVAGAAALLLMQNPGESPGSVTSHLMGTAAPTPDFVPASGSGAGLLQVKTALITSLQPLAEVVSVAINDDPAFSPSNDGDGKWEVGETLKLTPVIRTLRADIIGATGVLSTADPSITVTDANGGWGTVRNGNDTVAGNEFFVSAGALADAHRVSFDLTITNTGGTYNESLSLEIQLERPVPWPGGTYNSPVTFLDENTYEILTPTVFNQGLTIQPGTVVRLGPGVNLLVTGGTLNANGNGEAPISILGHQQQSPDPFVTRGGRLILGPEVANAVLNHVLIEGTSGLRNDSPSSTLTNIIARNNSLGGIVSTVGTSPIEFCTVENNGTSVNSAGGIVAGLRPVQWCTANGNHGIGIDSSAGVNYCDAVGNTAAGIVGAAVFASQARNNGGSGIVSLGGVSNSTAVGNGGRGILVNDGTAMDLRSLNNGLVGIEIADGGTKSTLLSQRNGGVGILLTGGAGLDECDVFQNNGVGIQGPGAASVTNTSIKGNGGPPVIGVSTLSNSTVTNNGSGLFNVSNLTNCYVGENDGAGMIGGIVLNSVITGSSGPGLITPASVTNSWVVANEDAGIDQPQGDVTFSTIADNQGVGIANLLSSAKVNNNNIFDNGNFELPFDYYDDATDAPGSPASSIKDLRFNNWGTGDTSLLAINPFNVSGTYNAERIFDRFDNASPTGWYANYGGPGEISVSAVLGAPNTTNTPAFVRSVEVGDDDNEVVTGVVQFVITFSEPMNTAIEPSVTFDTDAPYEEHVVAPKNGWASSTVWEGQFWIQWDTGFGMNTVRVHGATAADGFVIPDDTNFEFVIADGAPAANSGVAVGTGSDFVQMTLTELQATLLPNDQGLNIRRSLSEPLGSYAKINGPPVTANTYDDTGLANSTTYYYIIDVVDVDGNAFQLTSPIEAITTAGDTADTLIIE